jgi:hypothetical protein
MQLSVWKWGALALLGLVVTACADEGVGDPCLPETIPCSTSTGEDGKVTKKCGFTSQESYIESSSVQCRSRLCIVHKLDNGTGTANPTVPCSATPGKDEREKGCVTEGEVSNSIFCTCRCGGPSTSVEFCECPDDFECKPILTLGGDGIRGDYCVRKGTSASTDGT